jgi:ribosomal protein S1
VFLKGTVNIDNYQDKEVTVTITKTVNGSVTDAKDGGKVVKKNPYSSINPQSEIKWEVKLAPNEKKTLNYDYEVLFVP